MANIRKNGKEKTMSRKGENIYKRKDKRWEARYIKGYDEKGNAKYAYLYAKSYREVRERLERAKIQLASGAHIGSICKRKFCAYCDEWLQIHCSKIAASTYVKYFNTIEKHIKPVLGGLRAETITTAVIARFSDGLLYEKGLSCKTVRDVLTILSSILKYANKQIGARGQEIEIVFPKCESKEMRVLTRAEQERLMAFLLTDMDAYKFGITLALMTGMRIGELCALRWKNVSLEERCIHIEATMQRLMDMSNSIYNTKVVISSPKSEKSTRMIPMTDAAVALCRRFHATSAEAFVLTGESARFCEPRRLQYRFARMMDQLDLQGIHFHSLRHTFATRCVEVGFEIKSLSEILGHASPKITLERYVHSSFELKRNNMQKLCGVGL